MKGTVNSNGSTTNPFLRRFFVLGMVLAFALMLLAFQLFVFEKMPQPALAQGTGYGTIAHTLAADFSVCSPTSNTPSLTNTAVSSANGGEIRLGVLVEDYFNGPTVDATRWITGNVETFYSVPQTISGGIVTLDASWLRSVNSFDSTTPVRFFEARALQRVDTRNAAWTDLGFYRDNPPYYYSSNPVPENSAIRLFINSDSNQVNIRSRDGTADWTDDLNIMPGIDLQQYHIYRIEWDASQTRYYMDGALESTYAGVSTNLVWAFLYAQTPSGLSYNASPMLVDWVRAGAYPASGQYVSCPLDAGQAVTWGTLSAGVTTPASTSVNFSTRTSTDGTNWSAWSAVKGGTVVDSPAGRYLQYRAELASSNVLQSPEVTNVNISYGDYSLRFYGNGTSGIDRVSIPLTSPAVSADIGSGDFTIEFWMRAANADNTGTVTCNILDGWLSGNIIFDRDIFGTSDFGDYGISIASDGRLAFGISQGGTGTTVCGSRNTANGAWHHVAITRNGTTGAIAIYVDGAIDGSGTGPTGDISYNDGRTPNPLYPNDPYLVLGAEKHDLGASFPSYDGFLDEVRLSTNIRYSAVFTLPTAHFIADANTAALYHFNEGVTGACTGLILDGSGAAGEPSEGTCSYGGSPTSGPVYSETTIPFGSPTNVKLSGFRTYNQAGYQFVLLPLVTLLAALLLVRMRLIPNPVVEVKKRILRE